MGIIKFFLAGLFLGLPFGPVGVLCMGNTIEKGRKAGFISALGAVTVDILYGIVAFFLLIPAKNFIEGNLVPLKIGIGIFLGVIGLTKIFGKVNIVGMNLNESEKKNIPELSLKKEFMKIFLISLPNAFNIITIIGLFTGLEIFALKENLLVFKLILGLFLAEVGFWFVTTTILSKLRDKITEKSVKRLIRICGLGILFFGLTLVFQGLASKI